MVQVAQAVPCHVLTKQGREEGRQGWALQQLHSSYGDEEAGWKAHQAQW